MVILSAALASSGSSSPFVLIVLFLFGALLFFLGFRTFREYRLLEDTPFIPARSIAMGLVHVRGKATGDDPLTSPITRQPCFYYRLEIEHYEKRDKHSGWERAQDGQDRRNFYLDDGSAKVLVDPQNAEYDVLQTFQGEFGPHSNRKRVVDASLKVTAPSEEELETFVQDSLSRARAAVGPTNAPGALTEGQAKPAPAKPKAFQISIGSGALQFDFGTGRSYRVTEHCLLAGRECNILGTCAENPAPKDEHDRNLIKRGQNEKSFIISTEGEKQVEKTYRNRAVLLVLLGASLSPALLRPMGQPTSSMNMAVR